MAGTTLAWGRHYAMVDPAQYRIDFAGGGFMDMVPVARPGWTRQPAANGMRLQPGSLPPVPWRCATASS